LICYRRRVPGDAKTRRARGERRREEILRAALHVIAVRGVGQTTHRAIAEVADVPPATTTYYFSSLDELLEEALRLFVREEVARLHELAARLGDAGADPTEVAALFAAELLGDERGKHDPMSRAQTTAQFELYLEATRRPALEVVARECVQGYVDVAVAALRATGTPGAEQAGPAFVALIDGFALHGLASPSHAVDADALRTALGALWAGWAATAPTT
jgi:DNA-binding transcriptional regulator YbjK